jgi:hypothetical protein
MPLKSAVPKIANDDAPQKLLDHLHPSSRLKLLPRNAMNRWKFDASMEVQEPPTFTERKKNMGRNSGKHRFRNNVHKQRFPLALADFIVAKTKSRQVKDFWIKTLSPIFVALLLCS